MIMIHPGAEMRGGVRQDPSSMQTLKLENYEKLHEECIYLAAISPNVSSSGQLIAGSNNYPSSVTGCSNDYLEIRQLTVEQGEKFSDNDIRTAAKVCVIGKTIVDNLFPDGTDPIGKIIRCNKIPLRVIGVLKSKGYNSMGQDQDDIVLAPYTTVMKRLLAQTYLSGIFASALTEDMTEEAVDEITTILRREHKLKASDEDDFTIRTQQELSSMLNTTTDPYDNFARLHCRYFARRRRHRNHEHHVCFGHRAHPRNRIAHVGRSTRHRYTLAIPDRIHSYQHHGRTDRGHIGMRSQLCHQSRGTLAGLYPAVERPAIFCRMYADRSLFRLVSGKESRRPRPD